ncbi:MAG: hypothetical protein ACYTDW_03090 [Planctomycetota bacterium]
MNLRKREDGTHSRHYKHPMQNQTLCGLSLKKGHAWAPSEAQFVTCANCERLATDAEAAADLLKQELMEGSL